MIQLISTLARLALPWWALGVLAIGSLEPETSSLLDGVCTAGFDPDSY